MKKYFLLLLIVTFCIPSFSAEALSVSGQYACLMDAQTGDVIYEKNAHKTHSMASTTKIMTALVALENSKPDEMVTISKNAARTEGSSLYLSAGETISMKNLLYGLMLQSGNDAAIAIAEHVGGNVENFARMMTDRAHRIGAKNTSFKNPNGLDAEGHYTTAYDLALITREALKNSDFAEMCATKTKNIAPGENSKGRTLSNHNKLLSLYPGCIGVKTGFTKKTGRCLVSAATRDHVTLIAVTLNAPNDWNDHTQMLNHGFSALEARPLLLKDMIVKSIPVRYGANKTIELLAEKDVYLSQTDEAHLAKIEFAYQLPSEVKAPIAPGAPLGKLVIFYDGAELMQMNLLAGTGVDYLEPPKASLMDNLRKVFMNLLNFGSNMCYN